MSCPTDFPGGSVDLVDSPFLELYRITAGIGGHVDQALGDAKISVVVDSDFCNNINAHLQHFLVVITGFTEIHGLPVWFQKAKLNSKLGTLTEWIVPVMTGTTFQE